MVFKQATATVSTLLLVLGMAPAAWADVAEEREDAIEELNRSREVFQEIATDPDTQIPSSLVRDSKAIIIVSNLGQGGFIFGARRGDGLMVLRQSDGNWSNPAFMTLGGASFGLQIGGRNSDLVMLVNTQEAIDDILDGEMELGGNVTGTAGPVGATVTDPAAANGDILIYSRSSGLFGGVTAGGTSIEFDEERNEAFYGVTTVTPSQIFTNPNLRPAASTADLEQTLSAAE